MKLCPELLPFNMLRALATAQVAATLGGSEKWLLMGAELIFLAGIWRTKYHSIKVSEPG
jgi:hypothetical protein